MLNNNPVVVVAAGTTISAASTTYSVDMGAAKGALLILNITAINGTPTLDIKLQRVGPAGVAIDLPSASFTQKTGTGSDDLVVYPGIAETANRSVSDHTGRTLNIVLTIGGTGSPSFTMSLGLVKLA